MSNKTLSDQIVDAARSGYDPAEILVLQALADSSITSAETAHSLNATFSNTEVQDALDALGSKINEILALLA